MNNFIQKGGLTQKEITANLLNAKRYEKFIIKNKLDLHKFYNEMIETNLHTKELTPNKKIFKDSMLEKKNENAFFAGFNAAFEYLFSECQKNTIEKVPLVLVDGVNIIRNSNILIGFFSLIKEKLPSYVNNVILLLYDTILIQNTGKYREGGTSFYDNLKIVLENVLPVILENLNMSMSKKFNMIVLQHDSAKLPSGQMAISNSRALIKYLNKSIYFIKIAKVEEDGFAIELPALSEIKTIYRGVQKTEQPSRIYAIKGVPIPHNLASPQMSRQPIFTYTPFEADDVAIVCIAYFYQMIRKHNDLFILSGDNFKWFKFKSSIKQRVCLHYHNIDYKNILLDKIEPEMNIYPQLDAKIFKLPNTYLEYIQKEFNDIAKLNPILKIAGKKTNNLWTMINTHINMLIKKKTPFVADSSDDEETVKKMKNKYIKYKSKYLLLKSQYN